MKFIKTIKNPDPSKDKPLKFLYNIPDHIINKKFGNIYIFQHNLINDEDAADFWLHDIMDSEYSEVKLIED
jgi:hypothetical protein